MSTDILDAIGIQMKKLCGDNTTCPLYSTSVTYTSQVRDKNVFYRHIRVHWIHTKMMGVENEQEMSDYISVDICSRQRSVVNLLFCTTPASQVLIVGSRQCAHYIRNNSRNPV